MKWTVVLMLAFAFVSTPAAAQVPHVLGNWRLQATCAEAPVDSHTVEWVDKLRGNVTAWGRKWVSADGQTLSFTAFLKNERNEQLEFLFVFDRI